MPRPASVPSGRLLVALAAAGALVLGLAACTPEADSEPSPDPSVSTSAEPDPTPSAEPTPEGPVLVPEGTADDNLPLFTAVVEQVWAGDARDKGRSYIDALVKAGFDKSAMQVTADQTTVGRHVESMLFSVRWGEEQCLVGQVGPSTGEPVTMVMDQLAEGRCLIGETRPIDW